MVVAATPWCLRRWDSASTPVQVVLVGTPWRLPGRGAVAVAVVVAVEVAVEVAVVVAVVVAATPWCLQRGASASTPVEVVPVGTPWRLLG